MAQLHHPVYNRRGEVIAAALTNLDLHDLARVAATYGVRRLFVVTPLSDQRRLAGQLVEHWVAGFGAAYNPDRRRALGLVSVVASLDEAVARVEAECGGCRPRLVATAARAGAGPAIGYPELARDLLNGAGPCLLLFGTASGLAEEALGRADALLEPIKGVGDYNHLSVRSAAAVILDRLVGAHETGG
jgi:hypothetical protein